MNNYSPNYNMSSEPDSKENMSNNHRTNKMLTVKTTIKSQLLKNKLTIISHKHNNSKNGLTYLMVKAGININSNIPTNWRESHKSQLFIKLQASTTLSFMMKGYFTI